MCLNLAHCANLDQKDIHSLIQDGYLSAVTVLSFAGCDFSDVSAQLLAKASPVLENLDIEQTMVSGIGVKALVLKPGRKLEKLKLNACPLLSADAVDFARASGVDVQFIIHGIHRMTRQGPKRLCRR